MTAVALIFGLLNFVGNLSNAPGRGSLRLDVVTLVFLALTMRVLRKLRGLDEADQSVAVLVQRQLHFFHLHSNGGSGRFGDNLDAEFQCGRLIEDQVDRYSIVAPVEFAAISAAVIFGGYASSGWALSDASANARRSA